MQVEFRRTGSTRYGIEVRRNQYPNLSTETAPGYDPEAPHDVLHFLAEAELGLRGGIFGQLAAGGSSGFDLGALSGTQKRELSRIRRQAKALNKKLVAVGRREMELSERAASIFLYEWLARSSAPSRTKRAVEMRTQIAITRNACSQEERDMFTDSVVNRVSDRLERFSREWAQLSVGGGIELEWPFPEGPVHPARFSTGVFTDTTG